MFTHTCTRRFFYVCKQTKLGLSNRLLNISHFKTRYLKSFSKEALLIYSGIDFKIDFREAINEF